VAALVGTFTVSGDQAIVEIEYLEAALGQNLNPFAIYSFAPARLLDRRSTFTSCSSDNCQPTTYDILQNRYGLNSRGGMDFIEIAYEAPGEQ